MFLSKGFSLIEVLISLFLLALILLGFDAMEIFALRNTRSAFYFNVATNQLQNMAERLRALTIHDDISQQERSWNLENQQVLPEGWGKVSGHYPTYTLTIFWGDTKRQ